MYILCPFCTMNASFRIASNCILHYFHYSDSAVRSTRWGRGIQRNDREKAFWVNYGGNTIPSIGGKRPLGCFPLPSPYPLSTRGGEKYSTPLQQLPTNKGQSSSSPPPLSVSNWQAQGEPCQTGFPVTALSDGVSCHSPVRQGSLSQLCQTSFAIALIVRKKCPVTTGSDKFPVTLLSAILCKEC